MHVKNIIYITSQYKPGYKKVTENSQMSVSKIIKNARGSHTQSEFAELLGTSQSLISKYESGAINPPAPIIEACMAIIHDKNMGEDINLDELIQLMIKVLADASQADRRKAFAVILRGLLTVSESI